MKKEKLPKSLSKTILRNSIIVFLCIVCFFTLFFGVLMFLLRSGVFAINPGTSPIVLILVFFLSFSIGGVITIVGAQKITQPISKLEEATSEIAKGNFDVVVEADADSELSGLIENFNKMAKELKTNETLKNDFISNVSHEFKTPLAVIQSYSKSLRRKGLDAKTRAHYEEVVDNNINKLTNLTNNILSLSKIEHQEIVPNKEEFLLDEQIRQSILSLESEWLKKEIDFNLVLPETSYYGSQELLSQVWQNLISNAIKFSKEKGEITISLSSEEGFVSISVSDNGIGMNEETLARIFDKFYQGDTSHSKDGNGLGLALVSRILKICEGEISVTSTEGEGSTFTVKLKNEKI